MTARLVHSCSCVARAFAVDSFPADDGLLLLLLLTLAVAAPLDSTRLACRDALNDCRSSLSCPLVLDRSCDVQLREPTHRAARAVGQRSADSLHLLHPHHRRPPDPDHRLQRRSHLPMGRGYRVPVCSPTRDPDAAMHVLRSHGASPVPRERQDGWRRASPRQLLRVWVRLPLSLLSLRLILTVRCPRGT